MKMTLTWAFLVFLCFLSCQEKNVSHAPNLSQTPAQHEGKCDVGNTIASRFNPPNGYVRQHVEQSSFAYYLRNFPLYPSDRKVRYFNGELRRNQSHFEAVLNIDVGRKDLQQCADAIMRLRAEFLYEKKRFNEINFHFVNGFLAQYARYINGQDIQVNRNQVSYVSGKARENDRATFKKFMEIVFMYAGTPSLEKELKLKDIAAIEIGDVLIQGGSPGHAVLVVDVAHNPHTGDRAYMLAQSFMPAQDIHIVKNPTSNLLSPWYSVAETSVQVVTPDWHFKASDLRSF